MGRRRLWPRKLGLLVQTNARKLALFAGLALLALCLPLRSARLDTQLASWLQRTERVERELQTISSALGPTTGSTSLLVLQATVPDPQGQAQDVLTVNALMVHLEALAIAAHVTVDLYDTTWSLRDLCFSPTPPDIDGVFVDRLLDKVMPCAIATPVDCFWEAAKLLGPDQEVRLGEALPMPKWTELNPRLMVEARRRSHPHASFPYDTMLDWMQRVGITSGYVEKPCLDPSDPHCPASAPNKPTGRAPDVAAELTGGCHGLAANEMRWLEEEIMGGISRNKSGHITSARALQSSIQLMDENDVYEWFDNPRGGLSIRNWSLEKAKAVLDAWQTRYQEELEQFSRSSIASKSYKIYAVTPKTMMEPINESSVTDTTNLKAAICFMVVFTLATFPRFERPEEESNISQNNSNKTSIGWPRSLLLAVTVSLVTILTFVASLGLSSYWMLPFNLTTTQILPPLALFYGFKQTLLVANTYARQFRLPERPLADLTVDCLDKLLSIVLVESVVLVVCLTVASVFQVPATRVFVCQAVIYFGLATFTTLVLLPSLITIFLFHEVDYRGEEDDNPDEQCKADKGLSIEDQILSRIQDDLKNIKADQSNRMPDVCATSGLPDLVLWPNYNMDETSLPLEEQTRIPIGPIPEHKPSVEKETETTTFDDNNLKKEQQRLDSRHFQAKIANFLAQNVYLHAAVLLIRLSIFIFILSLATRVKFGLHVKDIVPRGTQEYDSFQTQDQYFPIYNIFAVTKGGFDYPNNQRLLYEYHRRIEQVSGVMRDEDSKRPVFWLAYFRDWLISLQDAFDQDRNNSLASKEEIRDKSDTVRLAYKLLSQTGKPEEPVDQDLVGSNRLVDKNGIINQKAFYYYLPAWVMLDSFSYANSKANFKPEPRTFSADLSNLKIERARPLTYAQIPFLMKLPADQDSLKTIVELRTLSQAFEQLNLPNFLTGIPFIFWDQFINLDLLFFATVPITAASLYLIVGLITSDFVLSALVLVPLVTTLLEVYSLMGVFSIEFNNVYAVMLLSTIGTSVVQTIHFTNSFVKEKGDLVQRLGNSLSKEVRTVITTLLLFCLCGLVFMLSKIDFMIKYSYILLFMATINALNSLVVTPILLKIFGPLLKLDLIHNCESSLGPLPMKEKSRLAISRPRREKKNRSSKKYSGFKKQSKKRFYPRVQSEISLSTISEEP